MDSYDEIPYESTPYHETHPAFIATRARLFGIDATAPECCRVLEIGCASGGNLIPLAVEYPDSRFLGIELSQRQVQDGQAMVAQLGLTNIEIRQGDISVFPPDAGEFDYIIAHGVYSWVPEFVREAILRVCRAHLSANGVAYISYNTLPGWRWRGILRDMLLNQTRGITLPGERLVRAQTFLAGLEMALSDQESLNASYLREEIRRINDSPPSYLFHEYLETNNQPFMLSDFVATVRGHGLEYIADVELSGMFSFTLPDAAAQWVEQCEEPIDMWQQMDFIVARSFRQSLLCRAELKPDYDIDLERLTRYAFYADLRPQKQPDLRRGKTVRFNRGGGDSVEVRHPLTQAALLYLGQRYPDSIAYADLLQQAAAAVQQVGNSQAALAEEEFQGELFSLYAQQVVMATTEARCYPGGRGERPRCTDLARVQQGSGQNHVAGAHHVYLTLDRFSQCLMGYLDGEHTVEQLVDAMVRATHSDPSLHLLLNESLRRDEKRLRKAVSDNIHQLLALFARNGILAGGDIAL